MSRIRDTPYTACEFARLEFYGLPFTHASMDRLEANGSGPLPSQRRLAARLIQHWASGYILAILLFSATLGLSILISSFGIKLNYTIPVVVSLVAASWYGGRGPGLLISVLFHGTTMLYAPTAPDIPFWQTAFSHFSIFSLYVFLVLLISRLRTIQRRVVEQRDMLEVTLSSIGDAVIATDLKGRVTFVNPVAENIIGWSSEDAQNRPLSEVMHVIDETSRQPLTSPVNKVLQTGETIGLTNHTLAISRDGREVPIDNRAAPIRHGDDVKGVVMVFSDVSRRKRADRLERRRTKEIAALYDLSERLQHARTIGDVYQATIASVIVTLECDRAAILLFDQSNTMRFVAAEGLSSEYCAAVEGHSPWNAEETDAKPFGIEDLDAAELEPSLSETIRQEGIASLAFVPLITKDRLIGKLMIYFDGPHRFTSSEFEMAMTVANQIAAGVERRGTEARLFENEERLRLATQTGKVGAWDWDIRSNSIQWTDAVYRMHGVTREDFGGSVEDFTRLIHPDDRELVGGRIEQALAGEVSYEVEFRVLRPDGEIAWLFTNAVILRDEHGPFRMIGATTDITGRIKAEAAKRESEIMHRLVAAQESERKRIARDLHDHLGQQMTALRLKIDALTRPFADESELKAAVADVQNSAAFIDRDISYLSWELRPTELEDLGLVDALKSFVREWSKQYGINADFHAETGSYYTADNRLPAAVETNLYRIVQEALNNITKHAGASTVSVLFSIKNDVMLIVEDDGVGFARSSGPLDLTKPGGLGLIGMNERASLLGGTLNIETNPGAGTTIRIRCPLSRHIAETGQPSQRSPIAAL